MAPASLRQRVTADNELLRFGDLEFDPGTAAPAAFVDRIWLFGDQPLEAKLLCDSEQIVFTAAESESRIFSGGFLSKLPSSLRLVLSGLSRRSLPPKESRSKT